MIIKPNCCEKPLNAARSTMWVAALVKARSFGLLSDLQFSINKQLN